MFVDSFKYYKAKSFLPNFHEVIDVSLVNGAQNGESPLVHQYAIPECANTPSALGLTPTSTWRVFTFPQHPGLMLVQNPFTTRGQRYWIARCLRDLPKAPNANNLNPQLFTPEAIADWWSALQQCRRETRNHDERRRLKVSMRWATLGYQHDWETKVYSDGKYSAMPADIQWLCSHFAFVLGFRHFMAQAAIVNYYPLGTTLAGHTDHSEVNHQAPLFSISFGQTAVFLIGGKTKDERPHALYLRSGDVLIMSAESRLCYHAVPRVMKEMRPDPWNEPVAIETAANGPETVSATSNVAKKVRIETTTEAKPSLDDGSCMDMLLYEQIADEAFWSIYKEYLNESRINLNVRQVHTTLDNLSPVARLSACAGYA